MWLAFVHPPFPQPAGGFLQKCRDSPAFLQLCAEIMVCRTMFSEKTLKTPWKSHFFKKKANFYPSTLLRPPISGGKRWSHRRSKLPSLNRLLFCFPLHGQLEKVWTGLGVLYHEGLGPKSARIEAGWRSAVQKNWCIYHRFQEQVPPAAKPRSWPLRKTVSKLGENSGTGMPSTSVLTKHHLLWDFEHWLPNKSFCGSGILGFRFSNQACKLNCTIWAKQVLPWCQQDALRYFGHFGWVCEFQLIFFIICAWFFCHCCHNGLFLKWNFFLILLISHCHPSSVFMLHV